MGVVLNTGKNIYIHVSGENGDRTILHCAEGIDIYSSTPREIAIRQRCRESTDEPDKLHEGELAGMLGVDLKGIENLEAAEIFTEHLVRIEEALEKALKTGNVDLERMLKLYEVAAKARKDIAGSLERSPRWDRVQIEMLDKVKSASKKDVANDAEAIAAKKALIWRLADICSNTDFPDGHLPELKRLQLEYATHSEKAEICSNYDNECYKQNERLAREEYEASLIFPPGAVPSRHPSIWDSTFAIGIGPSLVMSNWRLSPLPGTHLEATWQPLDEAGISANLDVYLGTGVRKPEWVWQTSRVTEKGDQGVVITPGLKIKATPFGTGASFDVGAEFKHSKVVTATYYVTAPDQKATVQLYKEETVTRAVPTFGFTARLLNYIAWEMTVTGEWDFLSSIVFLRTF